MTKNYFSLFAFLFFILQYNNIIPVSRLLLLLCIGTRHIVHAELLIRI